MTTEEIAQIERRASEATSGPWESSQMDVGYGVMTAHAVYGPHCEIHASIADCHLGCNAAFLAHARDDVPALIAEIRRLREIIAGQRPAPCQKCDD